MVKKMSIARMSVVNNTDRNFKLIVDDYNGFSFQGIIYHNNHPEGICYESLLEMIINVDNLMDEIGSPKQSFQMRRFPGVKTMTFAKRLSNEKEREGKLATFQIRFYYRNHASWQGSISWKNGEKTENFESAIQMVLLIIQILNGESYEEQNLKELNFCHVSIDSYDAGRIVGKAEEIETEKVEKYYVPADLAKRLSKYMEIGITEEQALKIRFDYKNLINNVTGSTFSSGGKRASFSIKIMFREHNTWQGMIYWHEDKAQQPFRSFKELLFLVASAVGVTEMETVDKNKEKMIQTVAIGY
jgi:hypothetical protein